jgi:hypothetical protein
MDKMEHKRFQTLDETREFPPGCAEIRNAGGMQAGRLILEPGWRWPADVRPTAGTDWCEAPHSQCHVSGQIAVQITTSKLAGIAPGREGMSWPGR